MPGKPFIQQRQSRCRSDAATVLTSPRKARRLLLGQRRPPAPSPTSGWLALVLLALFFAAPIQAAQIQLDLNQHTSGDVVEVTVRNTSSQHVTIVRLAVELAGASYVDEPDDAPWVLRPDASLVRRFLVELPETPGSYAQRTTVFYLNEGLTFSLSGVGYLHHQASAVLPTDSLLLDAHVRHEGVLELRGVDAGAWRLVLPDELTVVDDTLVNSRRLVRLQANRTGFITDYPIFAVRSAMVDGRHHTAILSATLHVDDSPGAFRGRVSNRALLVLLVTAGVAFLAIWRRNPSPRANWTTAFGKYAARAFWLAAAYLVLKNADSWFHAVAVWADGFSALRWGLGSMVTYLPAFPDNPVAAFFFLLRDNLRGSNYAYFFQWFADPYFIVCLLLCLFYSRYLDYDRPLHNDKYAAALSVILLSARTARVDANAAAGRPPLLPPAKLGFLAIGVKLFFLPYLASWLINNVIHQWHLSTTFSLTFSQINAYLLAFFILVDSAVFTTGYAVESRRLDSGLRSVEPTLLGWIVCLWCYPPFNSFSFAVFDYPIVGIYLGPPGWVEPIAIAAVTLCWGIFAWASVALGFKASNLTNRGIVRRGPYRWCRHPAYAAKILAWTIEAIFLGRYYAGLLIAFIIVYGLRAWTEERHLSRDPDYTEYKQCVRYRFIPGLF